MRPLVVRQDGRIVCSVTNIVNPETLDRAEGKPLSYSGHALLVLGVGIQITRQFGYNQTSLTSLTRRVPMIQSKRKSATLKRTRAPATWQLQIAKARFSEVFRKAREEGPQRVTKHGGETVVIVPAEEFDRLLRRSKQPESLLEFFAKSPLAGSGIDLEREDDYGRDIDDL